MQILSKCQYLGQVHMELVQEQQKQGWTNQLIEQFNAQLSQFQDTPSVTSLMHPMPSLLTPSPLSKNWLPYREFYWPLRLWKSSSETPSTATSSWNWIADPLGRGSVIHCNTVLALHSESISFLVTITTVPQQFGLALVSGSCHLNATGKKRNCRVSKMPKPLSLQSSPYSGLYYLWKSQIYLRQVTIL